MKKMLLCMFALILIVSSTLWGETNEIGKKLLSAIHDESMTEAQILNLVKEYESREIIVDAYVVDVVPRGYYEVTLKSSQDLSNYDLTFDVSGGDSPGQQLPEIKKLKKGQKITVIGKVGRLSKGYWGYYLDIDWARIENYE